MSSVIKVSLMTRVFLPSVLLFCFSFSSFRWMDGCGCFRSCALKHKTIHTHDINNVKPVVLTTLALFLSHVSVNMGRTTLREGAGCILKNYTPHTFLLATSQVWLLWRECDYWRNLALMAAKVHLFKEKQKLHINRGEIKIKKAFGLHLLWTDNKFRDKLLSLGWVVSTLEESKGAEISSKTNAVSQNKTVI